MSQSPSVEKHLLPNPFGCVVGRPLDNDLDVAEINQKAFASCQRLVEDAIRAGSSAALTLYGEAGTGKTHLLGRVRKWLRSVPGSLFVLAPMDTSARMLWRHLRRSLAEALLRPSGRGRRALDDLLAGRWEALDSVPERDLAIVLGHLLTGTNLRDAAAWLRGQELPEAALQRLELSTPGEEDNQEAAARDVIVALCSLLEPGPVVFCLDQMEALQNFPGDKAGLFAAGKAIWLLHDRVRNACIVCCLQAGFQHTLENVLDEATQQRMLRNADYIRPLDWAQAQRLIAARLDAVPAMAELRRGQNNPLWPLSAEAIQSTFVGDTAPARKVISRCSHLFDQWRTGEAPAAEPLDAALEAMLEERTAPKEPSDAEAAFRDGLPLLLRSLGLAFEVPASPSPFDFSWNRGRSAIAICNQVRANSLASRLKKISEAWNPFETPRLLLLRDARMPIGANARVSRQCLRSIEEQGGRLIPVSQEAVESLAALRRLLADAESGDLAHRGEAVPPGRVEQWMAGHMPSALDPLIAQLRSESAQPQDGAVSNLRSKLAALLAESKIIGLDDAARELQARPEEVESCALGDPRLFGLLGGPAPALFQPVHLD
jgi:hypothetical protein